MTIEEIIKSDRPVDIHKKILLNILVSQQVISERFAEVLKPFDLSGEQFNVLRILRGRRGEPANMCSIQERMLARTSNTTRLVDKLLAKGLVQRRICQQNRRKMEVTITARGLEILEQLDPVVEAHDRSYGSEMSATELETLNVLLEKYRKS